MCVCVCVYVCMCRYTNICVCVYVYVYLYIYIYTSIYVYMWVCIYMYIYILKSIQYRTWLYTHTNWILQHAAPSYFGQGQRARRSTLSLFYRALLQKRPMILRSLLMHVDRSAFEPNSIWLYTEVNCIYNSTCLYSQPMVFKEKADAYIDQVKILKSLFAPQYHIYNGRRADVSYIMTVELMSYIQWP